MNDAVYSRKDPDRETGTEGAAVRMMRKYGRKNRRWMTERSDVS